MPRKISKNHQLVLKQLAKAQGKTYQQLLDERHDNQKDKYKQKQKCNTLTLQKKKRKQDLIDLRRLANKQKLLRQQLKESK